MILRNVYSSILSLSIMSSILFTTHIASAQVKTAFINLTNKDGLADQNIEFISPDSKGYIWIATNNGLSRFDGYSFNNYRFDAEDTTSLKGTRILDIFEDSKGNLWVGTTKFGVSIYNYEADRFEQFTIPKVELGIIRGITEDQNGTIWFASRKGVISVNPETKAHKTYIPNETLLEFTDVYFASTGELYAVAKNNHLLRYNADRDKFEFFFSTDEKSESQFFTRLAEDHEQNLWLGSEMGGAFRINPNTGKSRNYLKYNGLSSIGTNTIWDINCHNGDVYIGSLNANYSVLNKETDTFEQKHFQNSDTIPCTVSAISFDKNGNLYVGTHGKGLFLEKKWRKQFKNFKQYASGFSTKPISDLYVDKNNTWWIAIDGDGLFSYTEDKSGKGTLANIEAFNRKAILDIQPAGNDELYMAAWNEGIIHYNTNTKEISEIKYKPEQSSGLTYNNIKQLYLVDSILWVVTHGDGVNWYNINSKQFLNKSHKWARFRTEPQYGNTMIKTSDDVYWVGTVLGLYAFEGEAIKEYRSNNDQHSIVDDNVNCLFEDSKQNLWIGTTHSLHLYNRETDRIIPKASFDGIVCAIEEDNFGNLWVSTQNGLVCYNIETEKWRKYTEKDGLTQNMFAFRSSLNYNNDIYFGHDKGVTAFTPSEVFIDTVLPSVPIIEVEVSDINYDILYYNNFYKKAKKVKFGPDQSRIKFHFTSLGTNLPERVSYSYKLIGYNQNWHKAEQSQPLVFTNLSSGDYTFAVRAENGNGTYVENTISFTILPPFWLSWVAFILYGLVLLVLLYIFRNFTIIQVEAKNKLHLEKIQRENAEQLHLAKMRFFTNISHELRTPLTLILNPLKRLSNQTNLDKVTEDLVKLAEGNAEKLLELVNQLLDVRKIEVGKYSLNAHYSDISALINNVAESFIHKAEDQNLSFIIQKRSQFFTTFDRSLIEKLINNLLSNAFKFTEKGTITIEFGESNQNKSTFILRVTDTGPGIDDDDKEKVFERYFTQNENKNSTGIGLHLCKEITKLHNGEIYIENNPLGGSVFIVELPLQKDTEKAEEETVIADEPETTIEEETTEKKRELVLVAEDNEDVRFLLETILNKKFQVLSYENGLEALDSSLNTIPDIIISDVMMPEMDGVEFCSQIKSNIKTSHIPFIMLTAKANESSEKEGLKAGADDFIAKPFDEERLMMKIENILATRKKYKINFIQHTDSSQENNELPLTIDEKFIIKLKEIIAENYSDADFGVEALSEKIGMDRSHLYRKVKSITDISPINIILDYRLNKAKDLLEKGGCNVSEVAYLTGFNSPKYFGRKFKAYFNQTPKEVLDS